MAKPDRSNSVVDLVAAYEAKRARTYGRSRRAVTVLRDELREALAAGYSIRTIWAALSDAGRIDSSYAAFARAIARMGIGEPPAATASAKPTPPPSEGFSFPRPEPGPRIFHHNPRPSKKDILA